MSHIATLYNFALFRLESICRATKSVKISSLPPPTTKTLKSLETTWALIEALIYHSTTVTPMQREKDLASWYALVKVQAGRTLEKVNRECQQMFGGLGYSRGGKGGRVEQVSRDLRVLVVGGGSDEILTDLVARQMDSRRKSAKL